MTRGWRSAPRRAFRLVVRAPLWHGCHGGPGQSITPHELDAPNYGGYGGFRGFSQPLSAGQPGRLIVPAVRRDDGDNPRNPP